MLGSGEEGGLNGVKRRLFVQVEDIDDSHIRLLKTLDELLDLPYFNIFFRLVLLLLRAHGGGFFERFRFFVS